jgi:hypothetical protein
MSDDLSFFKHQPIPIPQDDGEIIWPGGQGSGSKSDPAISLALQAFLAGRQSGKTNLGYQSFGGTLMVDLTPMARYMYETYGEDAQWKSHKGDPMPTWHNLTDAVRQHWLATADAAWGYAMSPGQQEKVRIDFENSDK